MFNATDVFPRNLSESVSKLQYPIKNFKYVASSGKVKVFVLFMEPAHHKIYYSKRDLTERYRLNIVQMGVECRKFGYFFPNRITWENKAAKFKKLPVDQDRKNSDVRLGFKFENQFLIKADFTFGLRTVKENTAHVIQTLNVPLVIYLYSEKAKKIMGEKKPDGFFPYENMHLLDMGILSPHTVFRIPSNATYMLYSTQKNFFSLDVVDENLQLLFPFEDPTKNRVTKIPEIYDLPVKTPYIEEEEEVENNVPSSNNMPNDQYVDFYEFFATPPFGQQISSNNFCQGINNNNNNTAVYFEPDLMVAPMNNDCIQNTSLNESFLLERNVIIASPNFVENHQRLMYKVLEAPPALGLKFNSMNDQTEPLDLTMACDDILDDCSQPLDLSTPSFKETNEMEI